MIKKTAFSLTLILFALLPFNAFVTNYIHFGLGVGGISVFGMQIPINAWKEIIVILLSFLVFFDTIYYKRNITLQKLDWIIISFFILGILSAIFQTREMGRILYGFKYDFEFLWLFFVLRHTSFFTKKDFQLFIKTIIISGSIVLLFGFLQAFVLPKDFLLLFGYSPHISSWIPHGPLPMYHGVGDGGIIRIASTLSGPNQFAAYILILFFLGIALWFKGKKYGKIFFSIFTITALICLIFTFSRSAYIALFLSLLTGLYIASKNKKRLIQRGIITFLVGIIAVGGVFVAKPSLFSDVLLRVSSSQGHYERSRDAIFYSLQNPLGYGIGNAGPASARFNEDKIGWISESWYLQISLELGIIGLILFVTLLIVVLKELFRRYRYHKDFTVLSLFLSLVGLSLTSLVLHSWEESAVALTLWGIMGIALNSMIPKNS